jgi:hypothetical protein
LWLSGVEDEFDSTNGTSVNDEPVIGEKELMPNDCLKVGPLEFRVVLEKNVPVSKLTPVPQSAATLATSADEPRAIKRRRKKYHFLTMTRAAARQRSEMA